MFNQTSGISDNTACSTTNVVIDFKDFLDALRDNESRVKSSLNCKNNTLRHFDSDCWWAQLHDKRGTLMASMAYSTWKILPSGEKVLIPLS